MLTSQDRLVSRSTIVILSAVLIGMGAGGAVGTDIASLCGYAGLLGLASFCALHLVAEWRSTERNDQLSSAAASRLSKHRSGIAQLLHSADDRPDPTYVGTVATSADPRARGTTEPRSAAG
jgi:hypothetical protein